MCPQDPETLSGYAQHKIISDVLHEAWFLNKTACGVEFASYFKPISLVTLALIFSAVRVHQYMALLLSLSLRQQIEFCIGEWSTGEFTQAVFNEDAGRSSYEAHLKHLKEWNDGNPIVISKIRNKLFECAM